VVYREILGRTKDTEAVACENAKAFLVYYLSTHVAIASLSQLPMICTVVRYDKDYAALSLVSSQL
jgi:hypothetical protein